MIRRLLLVLALAVLPAARLGAQVKGTRFEITAVGDSTVSFAVGSAQWVHPGLIGITVDPRRRDAFVTQFRIISVERGIATALITGQTTRPAMEHVALLEEPQKRFFKTLGFWGGMAIGFLIGVVAGTL